MDEDIVQLFLAGQRAFGERVAAITEAQWSAPTPDDDWTVLDLVDHLVDQHRWVPPLLHGLDLDAAGEVVAGTRTLPVDGGVGSNHAELWDEAATVSSDAVVEPGVLEREVALSRGATPAGQYLLEMTVDLAIHSWDLGTAIGYAEALPADLVDFAHAQVSTWGDVSGSEYFGSPVEVPSDASTQDKLVALTGRDPNWSPS
jgi:uncharacterized protein (TIGR03086 family)